MASAGRERVPGHRTLWAGYPPPFTGFDRVVEVLEGPRASYLGRLFEVYPADEAWRVLHARGGFSIRSLGYTEKEVKDAVCKAVGPWTTRRRWHHSYLYPIPWERLDRLVRSLGTESWLHAVGEMDLARVRRSIPPAALTCLLSYAHTRLPISSQDSLDGRPSTR